MVIKLNITVRHHKTFYYRASDDPPPSGRKEIRVVYYTTQKAGSNSTAHAQIDFLIPAHLPILPDQ